MRRRKADLALRVNAPLHIEHTDSGLTSFAGLELLSRYLRKTHFNRSLRRHLGHLDLPGDFPLISTIRLLLCLLMVGGRRLRHVGYLAGDPLVHRFSQLSTLPTDRTLSRRLKRFSNRSIQALRSLNAQLVASIVLAMRLRTVTIDVDGTVISTGMQVERAFRGYNPHHRKVPSYFPITAYLAETGHLFRLQNRSGNINDGKASIGFLRDLFDQVESTLGSGMRVRVRMDGDYFKEAVIRTLESRGAEYAIKVPFWPWLNLGALIRARQEWTRIDDEVDGFSASLFLEPWQREVRLRIYRRRVFHQTRKGYQLSLFDPHDGMFEFSVVATNLPWDERRIWWFMCGRGAHEKAIGELKSGLALSTVPTDHYGANGAWQQLVVIAHTLLTNFQIETGAPRRCRTWKRTPIPLLRRANTLRFELLNRAGRLTKPGGRAILRLADNSTVRNRFAKVLQALESTA
ncbi:MAG: IS1380 family transposase [Candidatus Eisenbacteria bacterium]